MQYITMPKRDSWKEDVRGTEVSVKIPISTPQLEYAIKRTYTLLDNHLHWLSVTLPHILQHVKYAEGESGELYKRAIELRNEAETHIEDAERHARKFRESVPKSDAVPSGTRTLVGVRKTPLSTRITAVYALLDETLVDYAEAWIDGSVSQEAMDAAHTKALKVAKVVAVEVGRVFRSGLDVLNRYKEMKEAGTLNFAPAPSTN